MFIGYKLMEKKEKIYLIILKVISLFFFKKVDSLLIDRLRAKSRDTIFFIIELMAK